MSEPGELVGPMLREAVVGTFGHYGLAVSPVGPCPGCAGTTRSVIGVLGFTGARARGTLVLGAPTAAVRGSRPAIGEPARDAEMLRDWIGELTNLVAGSLALALARRGVEIQLSTPVALLGDRVHVSPAAPSRAVCWEFATEHGAVEAWLDFDLDAVALPAEDGAPRPGAGEPLLF